MKIKDLVPVFVPVVRQSPPAEPRGDWELVTGEPTGISGLVVTPEVAASGRRYTGRWRITHAPSGAPVGPPYAAPDVARDKVEGLAGLPVSWNSVRWPLGAADEGLRSQVDQVLRVEPATAA